MDATVVSVRITMSCAHTVQFTMRFDDFFFGVDLIPVELQTFAIE
jgi:hypothetical protein